MAERGGPRRARRRSRAEKRAILIVTNGALTELIYLKEVKQRALAAACERGEELSIKVAFINGEPESVVRKLRSPHGDTRSYDEIWIVVDEDGQDREGFLRDCVKSASARQQWSGIVSRPCFEVWLIAHYEQVRRYADQQDAQKHLKRLAPRDLGDKELPEDFPYDAMALAVGRARLKDAATPAPGELPPSPGTSMPDLLRRLGLVE